MTAVAAIAVAAEALTISKTLDKGKLSVWRSCGLKKVRRALMAFCPSLYVPCLANVFQVFFPLLFRDLWDKNKRSNITFKA